MVSYPTVARIYRAQIVLTALASIVCVFAWPDAALGVFLGGAIMALNFAGMRFLLRKLTEQASQTTPKGTSHSVRYAVLMGVKFVFMLAIIALILHTVKPHASMGAGFALGLSTWIAAAVGVAIFGPILGKFFKSREKNSHA